MKNLSMTIFLLVLSVASNYVLISYASVVINAPISENSKLELNDEESFPDNYKNKNGLLKETDADEKEDILKLSNFALNKLDELDTDGMSRTLIDIIDSKKEFVNGIMYHLTLLVAITKKPAETDELDDVDTIEKNICKVKVLRTWAAAESLNNAQLVQSQCDPERREIFKRSVIVGGKTNADVNRDDIKKAARLGLQKLVELSATNSEQCVSKILSAKTQVVAGILYDIQMEICDSASKKSCEVCTITSVEQAWLESFEVINTDCKFIGTDFKNLKLNNKNEKKVSKRSYDEAAASLEGKLYSDQFLSFIRTYDIRYTSEDEMYRRYRIFRANLKRIKYLRETEQGTGEYGVTEFADLTRSEFRDRHLGLKPKLEQNSGGQIAAADIPDISLPVEFDWRHYNVVTEVKNQGFCGSCWAFSVTGNVEGQYALKHKRLVSFSEQELVDCDNLDEGCNGGYMTNAYQAIEKLGGLESESDYPYSGYGRKCHFAPNETVAEVTGFVNISTNETKIAQWLVKNGPISVGINANAMQFYFGGVSHPLKFLCDPKNLDHGVLIVGYGVHTSRYTRKSIPYWIIKNSWGKRWGVQGYYLLYRGGGVCGINTSASSAFVA